MQEVDSARDRFQLSKYTRELELEQQSIELKLDTIEEQTEKTSRRSNGAIPDVWKPNRLQPVMTMVIGYLDDALVLAKKLPESISMSEDGQKHKQHIKELQDRQTDLDKDVESGGALISMLGSLMGYRESPLLKERKIASEFEQELSQDDAFVTGVVERSERLSEVKEREYKKWTWVSYCLYTLG